MISVIIPVFNEEAGVEQTLKDVQEALKSFEKYEIILVNDGSQDETLKNTKRAGVKDLKIIDHPENLGYGKSLYDGIVNATYDCIAIIDGDGSYSAQAINELYRYYPRYDMVIGARAGNEYKKGTFKMPARILFRWLTEYAAGRRIPDINSGLRIFKRDIIMKFPNFLCAGFSFSTTITLLFCLNLYCVKYVPVEYKKRLGNSKVRHLRDTLRALQIVVGAILYFNPIKLYLLLGFFNIALGIIVAIVNHLFLNMEFLTFISALCVASFVPIFSLGLLADQIRQYNRKTQNL